MYKHKYNSKALHQKPHVISTKIGESNLADVIVDSPLIRLLTALRFDPNTDPLRGCQLLKSNTCIILPV